MPNSNVPITAGTGTNIDTFTIPGGDHRQVVMIGDHGGYKGRAATFRIMGRAATSQNLFAIHNATGSAVVVDVRKITVDVLSTTAVALTLVPPIIRLYRFTALPTNGSTVAKVPEDTSLSSSSSVTLFQDASADATPSGTTLTVTATSSNIITEEYSSRIAGGAGTNPLMEIMDRAEFLAGPDEVITLRALEGVLVRLDTPVAPTVNVNSYLVTCRWEEYTA